MRRFFTSIFSNKVSYGFLLLSMIFSISVISVGMASIENMRSLNEQLATYKNQFYIHLQFNAQIEFDKKINIAENVLKSYEIELPTYDEKNNIMLKSTKVLPDETPPLIKGRYFHINEKDKVAVIGKDVKADGEYVTIENERFKVIGVIGKEKGTTIHDNEVYIPLRATPKRLQDRFKLIVYISAKSNKDNVVSEIESFKSELKTVDKDIFINIEEVNNKKIYSVGMNRYYSILALKLWLVAIMNCLIMSYFSILNRKKHISIMKVLGGSDIAISFGLIIELLFVGVIAALLSLILQNLIVDIIYNTFDIMLNVDIKTAMFSIIAAAITVIFSSIPTIVHTLKIEPAEALKE